jgi:hypothetical protein
MKRFQGRLLTAVGTTALALALLGGTAYAVWTSTGTGSGSAAATGFQAVTVNAGSAPAGQLYPGLVANGTSAGGDLVVSASNPNPFPVTVTVTAGTATGCTTPSVSLGVTASFTLPASSGTVTRTMSKVLSMGTGAGNDCQSATITIPLTTSAVSS